MGFWDTFTLGNIDDIRYKPVETVCDMISEPSKRKSLEHKQKLEMELRELDAKIEAERKNQDFELAERNKDTMGSGFWENLTLGKIDDIIYKPVETVCDNISEKNK